MPDFSLAVIIPSTLKTQQIPFLRKAVNSISSTKRITVKIFVVSTQTASPSLKKEFTTVTFLKAKELVGFGELNNVAVEHIRQRKQQPDWLLLLNDDAWLSKDFLSNFAQLVHQSSAELIAPVIFEADRPSEIDVYGVEYFRSGYAKNCRSKLIDTTLATAGCLLLSWQFVERFTQAYGFFFNPIYFYYLEDVELTLRARMIGAQIERSDELIVYHKGSQSSGGRRNTFALYHTYRNIVWVMICCWPLSAILRNMPNILLVQVWVLIYGTWRCGVLTYPRIVWQTVTSLPKLLRYRERIQKARQKNIPFSSLMSPYSFRTFHNRTIPAI